MAAKLTDYKPLVCRVCREPVKLIRRDVFIPPPLCKKCKKIERHGFEVKGWVSIAKLSGTTSAECAAHHNRFYKNDGGIRGQSKPPRHPNCRCRLVPVYKGERIGSKRGMSLTTWLRRNRRKGRELMGATKYQLWLEGNASIYKYIDEEGCRWYRNDEIIRRLGIKSQRRLDGKIYFRREA